MKKQLCIGLGILLSIVTLTFSFFFYNCNKENFNDIVLSELDDNYVYLKRDEDCILKLYQSNSTYEQELIYEHDSKINPNIINADYVDDQLLFEAYHDESNSFKTYKLDLHTFEATIYEPSHHFDLVTDTLTSSLDGEDFTVISDNGSMYLSFENEKVLLEKFHGLYDQQTSKGYTPVSLSKDGKYLFYESSRHLTTIGAFIQTIFFNEEPTQLYVMNLETLEKSEFNDFHGHFLELNM